MKVGIIAIARQENLYINEWIDYHLGLGFDTIIICDNNDDDSGEKVSDIIKNDKVIILDYLNIESVQPRAYTEAFLKYKKGFDWLLFIDIDEFVVLEPKYHNNIKEFLNDSLFEKVDVIRLCWKIYTTNTDLDVINGNYSVVSRFKDIHISREENYAKSFIRGSIDYTGGEVTGHGYYENKNLSAVSAGGVPCNNSFQAICLDTHDQSIYTNAWINHYPTKTIGEYIRQKYFRGGPNANCRRYSNLSYFYIYNNKRPEVDEYARKLIKELTSVMVKEKYKKFYRIDDS
jgi:hypothetical protein